MSEETKKTPSEIIEAKPDPKPVPTVQDNTHQTPIPALNDTPTPKPAPYRGPAIIYFIIGVVEILLLFRFVFKLSAADPASGFVSFIYNVTDFLVAPYSVFVFEPGTLIAMVVYAFLAWGIAKIIIIAAGRFFENK